MQGGASAPVMHVQENLPTITDKNVAKKLVGRDMAKKQVFCDCCICMRVCARRESHVCICVHVCARAAHNARRYGVCRPRVCGQRNRVEIARVRRDERASGRRLYGILYGSRKHGDATWGAACGDAVQRGARAS